MDKLPTNFQTGFSPAILSLFNANKGAIYEKGRIISISKHLIHAIETSCDFSFNNPVDLIPGWVDWPKPIINRSYYNQDNVRFVTASRILPEKGMDIIIGAVALADAMSFRLSTIEITLNEHFNEICDIKER